MKHNQLQWITLVFHCIDYHLGKNREHFKHIITHEMNSSISLTQDDLDVTWDEDKHTKVEDR